jgi:hypothetical protein
MHGITLQINRAAGAKKVATIGAAGSRHYQGKLSESKIENY